jgi:hypothetical protein
MTPLLWLLATVVAGLTVHTGLNAILLRRPPPQPSPVEHEVDVLLPVRDEARRVEACLRSVLGQRGVPRLRVTVLDDGSGDHTVDVVRRVCAEDARVTLVSGAATPEGWLGKPHACHQLARRATAPVIIFMDADVVLTPDAVASAVALLAGFDLVSPYPRLAAGSAGERLVQPLLPWSWLTFVPVRVMERSRLAPLTAAGGQFLVFTRAGYERAGGHAAVRDRVLEDIELARAVKRTGGRVALADGSRLASCRMYASWTELRAGYQKSLWAAFGSLAGAVAVIAALMLLYAVPPVVAIVGSVTERWRWVWPALAAYVLAVVGRAVSARTTGGRTWPDALAQPVSIGLFAWLLIGSLRGRSRGTLVWKGRRVEAAPRAGS